MVFSILSALLSRCNIKCGAGRNPGSGGHFGGLFLCFGQGADARYPEDRIGPEGSDTIQEDLRSDARELCVMDLERPVACATRSLAMRPEIRRICKFVHFRNLHFYFFWRGTDGLDPPGAGVFLADLLDCAGSTPDAAVGKEVGPEDIFMSADFETDVGPIVGAFQKNDGIKRGLETIFTIECDLSGMFKNFFHFCFLLFFNLRAYLTIQSH